MSQSEFSSDHSDQGASSAHDVEDRNLRVVLEIVRGGPCFMDDLEGDIVDLNVRFDDDRCQCDVTVREPTADGSRTATKYSSNDLCDHCPGVVFSEHGCIPRYRRVGDGWFVMETFVGDTETVAEIVGGVRDVCERVTVRSIVATDGSDVPEICDVDVSVLTPKQREAVHLATEAGYYDPDSSVSLEEVGEGLSISKSALSQRLQRAEGNIIRQLSGACACSIEDTEKPVHLSDSR